MPVHYIYNEGTLYLKPIYMEGIFNASSMPYNALYDLMNNCNHLFIVTPLESIRY